METLTKEELVDILESISQTQVWAISTGWTQEQIWKLERVRVRVFGILNPPPKP